MGRKNFQSQPPKGNGDGLEGWNVSVRRGAPQGKRPWHNAWGNQSNKRGSWDDWVWDRVSENGSNGACGTAASAARDTQTCQNASAERAGTTDRSHKQKKSNKSKHQQC